MHSFGTGAVLARAFLLAVLAAPALPAAAAEVTVVDGGGRSVQVADASRILSIGGDVTEILYALGAGNRIVGVDTTSQFPPEALKDKKKRRLSCARCRARASFQWTPTVILASEGAGPPEVVKTLKATSVPTSR